MKNAAMILLVLTLFAAGCKNEPDKAAEGEACAKPEDCGRGLTCSTQNVCAAPAPPAVSASPEPPKAAPEPPKASPEPAKASENEACAKPEDCGKGLTCSPRSLCETPAAIKCRYKTMESRGETVTVCWLLGWCTAKNGRCVIGSDEDCQNSSLCSEFGRCTFKDGNCVTSDYTCSKLYACVENGYCKAQGDRCVLTDDGCRKSKSCLFNRHTCRAGPDGCIR